MTDPVVSVEWLADRLYNEDLRVVDVRWFLNDPERGRTEYAAAHIPGATFMDLDSQLSAASGDGRHPLPDRGAMADNLGRAGIGNEHHVVVYDTGGGGVAARLWWLLRWLGHTEVSILDGGWGAWKRGGYPTENDPEGYEPVDFYEGPVSMPVVDADGVASRLGRADLVDARAAERYRGEKEPIDPVAGHIPTAVNFPHTGNLTEDGLQQSPDELAERYSSLGSREVVVYCGSGVTACLDVLAMERAGLPTPTLYPGSWSDWVARDLPIVTGPDPL